MRSHMVWRSRFRLLPALLALCVLLLGCGTGATTPPAGSPQLRNIQSLSIPSTTTYLGTVPGTQAFIGLVINGTQARAYVCDGTPTRLATLDDWFIGQVQSGTFAATSQGGVSLRVQVTAQKALGTLTLTDGRTLPFTAPFVSDTSQAGVYEGTARLNGQSYHAGWVVLPSGDQRGAASYPSSPIKNIQIGALIAVCGSWRVVSSPSSGASENVLNAVSALTATDVWAVGDSTPASGIQQTLIEQWNGTTWTTVPSPNPGSNGNILYGVAAVSATDVWAVGDSVTGSGEQTLVEQWNGTSWSVVSSLVLANTVLYSVSAPSATTIWMAGAGKPTLSSLQETLLVRGNGSAWHPYFQSGGPQGSSLFGVAARSNADVWAVGSDFTASGSQQTLTEHWNGVFPFPRFIPSPSPGSNGNTLSGVTNSGAGVWAVGYDYPSSNISQTLIEQWNGAGWSVVPSPNPGPQGNALYGVTALSASNAWAVGYYVPPSGGYQALIEEWNGTTWSVVSSPNPGAPTTLNGVAAFAGSSTVWAVGRASHQTLTEATC